MNIEQTNANQLDRNAQYRQWAEGIIAAMEREGYSVSIIRRNSDSVFDVFAPPEQYTISISRDGVTSTHILGFGDTANSVMGMHDGEVAATGRAVTWRPSHMLLDPWLRPGSGVAPATQQQAPAGPSGTVQSPPAGPSGTVITTNSQTVQQTQTPPARDEGTFQVTPPPASMPAPPQMLYNLYEWNWYHEQETGRSGPAPEDVGVADPLAKMTRAQWWAIAGPWYSQPVRSGQGASGTSGGGSSSGEPRDVKMNMWLLLAVAGLGIAFLTRRL